MNLPVPDRTQVLCPNCGGYGYVATKPKTACRRGRSATCPSCQGSGYVAACDADRFEPDEFDDSLASDLAGDEIDVLAHPIVMLEEETA